MKKELTLIEIKDSHPIREWAHELMTSRKVEAVTSLKAEKVKRETVFYVEIDSKKYLAFFMEGEMLPSDMEQKINQEHRALMSSIRVRRVDAELLYDLELEDS